MAIFDALRRNRRLGNVPQSMASPEPAIQQAMPMRTGDEENAYRQGEIMSAEAILGRGANQTSGAGRTPGHIGPEDLRRADQLLLNYKNGKHSVDRRIIASQEWWKLRNWQQIEAERGTRGATQNKSNTAWLWNCIVGKYADAMQNYPEPIVLPRMQEDKAESKILSEIIPVVLQINGYEEVYSDCQWQKLLEGTACYGVFWDRTKLNGLGDISIRKVNVLNLFWEPGISDIQDSRNLFYVSIMDNETLEAQYPQLRGRLKANRLIANQYRKDDNIDMTNKSAVVDWYYHANLNGKRVLHYCKYVGDDVLFSTENEGMQDGLYADGSYPFVLDRLFPVENSPAGYGYIDIGKDTQADIDTLNQALVQNAATSATPRYFIRKDGGVNENEFSDWSKPLIHVNGNLGQDSVMPMTYAQMGGNSMTMLQNKIEELKFITSNTDVQNGQTPSGVTAASAVAALQQAAGRISVSISRSAYRAYARLITMVIERIRQFYDVPRQFRILGADGQEMFVEYSNERLQAQQMMGGMGLDEAMRLPVFDIDVRAQKENPYTTLSNNELALQFYQLGFFSGQQTDAALATIDMMEFKGKEEIRQKIEQQGTMQQALMQMAQIAMALAQKYQPELAKQIGMMAQSILGENAGMMPAGQMPQNIAAAEAQDAMAGAADPNESTTTRKARERAESSASIT